MSLPVVTRENYYTIEMNQAYMSASQYKAFSCCEAAALAELHGEWKPEETTAMLVGSYVDAHFDGSLDQFKSTHPALFTRAGKLRAEYKQAECIIERVSRDEMFVRYMSGEKQVVRTGKIDGVPFKIRMDSYHAGKCIVDLKVMRNFDPVWAESIRTPFVEAWGYDIQGAVYQAIEGDHLPFFIAGATKEREPDLAILGIPQDRLDYCLQLVTENVHRYDAIKHGEIEPMRCERCDYCRSTKKLTRILDYMEVGIC